MPTAGGRQGRRMYSYSPVDDPVSAAGGRPGRLVFMGFALALAHRLRALLLLLLSFVLISCDESRQPDADPEAAATVSASKDRRRPATEAEAYRFLVQDYASRPVRERFYSDGNYSYASISMGYGRWTLHGNRVCTQLKVSQPSDRCRRVFVENGVFELSDDLE